MKVIYLSLLAAMAVTSAWANPAPCNLMDSPQPTTGAKSPAIIDPTNWSYTVAYDMGHTHNVLALVVNQGYTVGNVLGRPNLSLSEVNFIGSQVQTSGSTASQGLTAGLGGQLSYNLDSQLFFTLGAGAAFSAGQQLHFPIWLSLSRHF